MGQQAGPARPKEFQCDSLSAAGVAAAAGFAEICLQFAETDTVYQSGEHKFSARWTKVMGTAEWKASRTRRWFKGLKPTVILLSRGISDAESSWRAGQGWQRKGRLRSVVWARTKPPPSECVHHNHQRTRIRWNEALSPFLSSAWNPVFLSDSSR